MPLLKTALIYFDQAIRDGSIRKAADNLHIASSAINRQLLGLEAELGVELFVRLPRGIRPTAAGEALLGCIRRWHRDAGALKEEVGRLKGGVRGTIRVAAAESLIEEVVPRAMARVHDRFPLVDFTLISGDNYRIRSELTAKDADLVCAFDVTEGARTETLHRVSSPIGVLMPADHPLAGAAEGLTLADCLPYPVVAPGLDWLKHSTIGRLFQEAGVPFRIVAQVERIGMMKGLVRAGTGIGFMSMVGLEAELAEGRFAWVPLRRGIIRPVTVSLLVRTGFVLPMHVGVFVDALKAELDALTRGTDGRRASALPVPTGAGTQDKAHGAR